VDLNHPDSESGDFTDKDFFSRKDAQRHSAGEDAQDIVRLGDMATWRELPLCFVSSAFMARL
jgi:hypothetical protein